MLKLVFMYSQILGFSVGLNFHKLEFDNTQKLAINLSTYLCYFVIVFMVIVFACIINYTRNEFSNEKNIQRFKKNKLMIFLVLNPKSKIAKYYPVINLGIKKFVQSFILARFCDWPIVGCITMMIGFLMELIMLLSDKIVINKGNQTKLIVKNVLFLI